MTGLHTRCPKCATVFRVTPEQLGIASGRVRCGTCEEVFEANRHEVAVDVQPDASPSPGLLNEDYIGGLLREESAPAEPADYSPVNAASGTGPAPLVAAPVELGASTAAAPHRRHMAWLGGGTLAMLLLAGAYAWVARERLTQDPGLRGHYARACEWLGCQLPVYHDPSRIRSDSLLIRPDPNRAGVLLVDAVLINQAPYPQRFPGLELNFTDIRDVAVARRVFGPHEYLDPPVAGDALLPPREPVRVHLELKDPGAHATNYELRLIELPPAGTPAPADSH